MSKQTLALVLLVSVAAAHAMSASEQPKPVFFEPRFEFGKVMRGTVVEHDFVLKNEGAATLRLGNVRMSRALTVTQIPPRVEPGAEASLRFKLDTSGLTGPFEGLILVGFADPSLPEAELTIEGVVVPRIETSRPAFFVAIDRGQTQQQSLEIKNNEPEPLRIDKVDYSSDRATVSLETIEEGRRYRLTLNATGEGAGGKKTEIIQLTTSSKSTPVLRILANTYVRERVYTFPDAVDLGFLPMSLIRKSPEFLKTTAQTLMVYRKGSADFEAKVISDLPVLAVTSERGPAGDRWQSTLTLKEEFVKPGPIKGSIVIETNDSEFSKLTIPVSGYILDR